jgi:hypothetical protein
VLFLVRCTGCSTPAACRLQVCKADTNMLFPFLCVGKMGQGFGLNPTNSSVCGLMSLHPTILAWFVVTGFVGGGGGGRLSFQGNERRWVVLWCHRLLLVISQRLKLFVRRCDKC